MRILIVLMLGVAFSPVLAQDQVCRTSDNPSSGAGAGRFVAAYCEPTSDKFRSDYEYLVEERYIDFLVDDMNNYVAIPEDIYVTYMECGKANAFYAPDRRVITMCYELYDDFEASFQAAGLEGEELDRAVENAEQFVFFHEVGHALVHILDLPITGREEDAVDQLATYIATDGIGPRETAAMDGARGFYYWALRAGDTVPNMALWGEHSLSSQRFYNIICWLYGEKPETYSHLVNNPLPEDRAVRCPSEWDRLDAAWTTLLGDRIVFEPDADNVEGTEADDTDEGEYLVLIPPDNYVEASVDETDSFYMENLVPEGQSFTQWTDMLTVTQYFGGQGSATKFRDGVRDGLDSLCPGGEFESAGEGEEGGYGYALWATDCPNDPVFGGRVVGLHKVIRGEESTYSITKSYRYEPQGEQIDWWVRYLHSITVCNTSYGTCD